MKTKHILFIGLFLTLLFFINSMVIGGPVMPNKAIVKGIVSGIEMASTNPENGESKQSKYNKITVLIESSEDVEGEENLLTNKKGEHITFYTKEPLSQITKGLRGKRIKVNISYRGDEHGGLWWGYNMEILQQ